MGQSSVLRRRDRIRGEDILGWKVENPDGEKLGTVDSVVVDPASREVSRVVIAFGGFLGLGAKRYAVPLEALSPVADRRVLLLPADKATIQERAEAWDVHDDAPPYRGEDDVATLYLPGGREEACVLRVELRLPDEIVSGEPFTESIRVANVSPGRLDRVVVRQELDAHFRPDPARGLSVQSGELVWELGSLAPDEVRELRLSGRAEGAERIRACCRASYDLNVCATRPVVTPKMELEIDAPRECLVCDEITVELRLRNAGTSTLRDVDVDASIPEGLRSADEGGHGMSIDVLRPGESRRTRLRLRPSRRGEYTLGATASGSRATARATARVAAGEPVLLILPGSATELPLGSSGRAEFVVKNVGDGPSRDTVVEAAAAGAARLRESGARARWEIGTLAPGESRTLAAGLDLSRAGEVEIALRAEGHCARAVSAKTRLEVRGVPALLLECVDTPDPARVGENVTYTIVALNQGSETLTNLRVRCEAEDSLAPEASEGPSRGRASRGALDFQPLASLAPGEKAVWRVSAKALKPADARFKVAVSCDQIPRPVEETESTRLY